VKIRIKADWSQARVVTGDDCFEIETEKPLRIEIDTPDIPDDHKVPMDHQIVLKGGWIECEWDKFTYYVTGLTIVPGDPFLKDDLQPMDWIQIKDPRKQ
jgi:hypothetical protein